MNKPIKLTKEQREKRIKYIETKMDLDWTQKEIAEKLGLTPSTLNAFVAYHLPHRLRKKKIRESETFRRHIRIYREMRNRSRKKGIKLTLSFTQFQHIELPKYCPVLGIKLNYTAKYGDPSFPTYDRIINSKGYVEGNVTVISYRANSLKRNATLEEIEQIFKYMKKHSKSSR